MTVSDTHVGVILGTAAYMSPEQARGQTVDKRADIWAFGCVLYEMLTGRPGFPGETVSDTIVAILEREPEWEALPHGTPPSIRRLLRRCLQKDRRRRLDSAVSAGLDIEEVMVPAADDRDALAHRRRNMATRPLLDCARCNGGGPAIGWWNPTGQRRSSVARITSHVEGWAPKRRSPRSLARPQYRRALTATTTLVFVGQRTHRSAVAVRASPRPVGCLAAILVTSGAHSPFFSPDGQWVAYFTECQAEENRLVLAAPR